jgi:hypothetical protein
MVSCERQHEKRSVVHDEQQALLECVVNCSSRLDGALEVQFQGVEGVACLKDVHQFPASSP